MGPHVCVCVCVHARVECCVLDPGTRVKCSKFTARVIVMQSCSLQRAVMAPSKHALIAPEKKKVFQLID